MVRLASLIRAGVSVRVPGRGRALEQIVRIASLFIVSQHSQHLDLACFDTIVVIVPEKMMSFIHIVVLDA